MGRTTTWDSSPEWTEAEREWFAMGPFDGGIPGLVRRIRRILDVSQRGLAQALGVSQSVVARWETDRTSPRASVLARLLRMAGLHASFHDAETGQEVEPMRDDGARQHGGSRFPAHTDLRVTGWWVPGGIESTMTAYYQWMNRSRTARDPMIRARTCPHQRNLERLMFGTPDDHPSLQQLVAEAEHLDERRIERGHEIRRSWAA